MDTDLCQLALEIKATDLRQPYIQNQATRVRGVLPAKKFLTSGFKARNSGVDGKKMSLEWEAKFYPTPKDDMSQPFDFGAAVRGTQVQFLIGYLTAQDDQRPAWNPGDFFGKVFGEASGR